MAFSVQEYLEFTSTQRRVLGVVADTFFPSIPAPKQASDAVKRYYETTPSECRDFMDSLIAAITTVLNQPERIKLKAILSTLSTVVGSALVIPVGPYLVAFADRTLEQREEAMLALSHSPVLQRRQVVAALRRLVLATGSSFIEHNDSGQRSARINPFWEAMGYPGAPRSTDANTDREEFANGCNHDFLLNSLSITHDCEKEFDIVIVGSGAGGGVAAGTLSKLGYKVLVLEKAQYVPQKDMTQLEKDAFETMFEKKGLLASEDGNVTILAGSAFGGGTAINWACCLDTPTYVREEWADKLKLPQFHPDSKEFNTALSTVKARMGVTDQVVHNQSNKKIWEGCAALGLTTCAVAPQNFAHTDHASAGWSSLGDRYGNKQGTRSTYLVDAAQHQASFVHEASVEKVITEVSGGRRRATGIVARVGAKQHKLTVKAKKCVIISAGSLHSPCLMLRSGFHGANVGKNLRLHPVTSAIAIYDTPIEVWNGAPMTTVCKECERGPNDDGYGSKLESPSMHAGLMLAAAPWHGGAKAKEVGRDARYLASVIVLQRDKDSVGQVTLGPDGFNPCIEFTLGEQDKLSMIKSLGTALQISARASGVTKLGTLHNVDTLWDVSGKTFDGSNKQHSEELTAYLKKVEDLGLENNAVNIFSAHQMGSLRMGCDRTTSVVDENGEVWDCDDLFVFDASIFPTASGSNPMMTTMTIAQMLSTRLGDRLRLDDKKLVGGTKQEVALKNREKREEIRSGAKQTALVTPTNNKLYFVVAAIVGVTAVYVSLQLS
eukprot:m.83448 g.83448  ORF g.83448 m.83448 type:complete len:777 (-) comp25634_c2_seq2:119-2449(-)